MSILHLIVSEKILVDKHGECC